MAPRGVRFWPPHAGLGEEVRWALLRSFADPGLNGTRLGNPESCLQIARRLGLLPRIFGRQPKELLKAELGEYFEEAWHVMQVSMARGLALHRAIKLVDDSVSSLGATYCLIKGAALAVQSNLSLGLRGAGDIDVLMHAEHAVSLQRVLKSNGFSQRTTAHPNYHLPSLADNSGAAIEIHTNLPYVGQSHTAAGTTLGDLMVSGQIEAARGLSNCAFVPKPAVMLAHCIAHGIAQHGFIPQSYRLMKMAADAIDLEMTTNDAVVESASLWLRSSVSTEELRALQIVCEALTAGNLESIWFRSGGAGRLLRHLVLSELEPQYAKGLFPFNLLHLLRSGGLRQVTEEFLPETAPRMPSNAQGTPDQTAHAALKSKILRRLTAPWRLADSLPSACAIAARRLRGSTD